MDVKLSDKMNVSDSGALLNQSEKGCIGADEGTLRLTRLSVVALPYTTQGCSSLGQRFSAGEHCDTIPQVNAVRHLHFEDTLVLERQGRLRLRGEELPNSLSPILDVLRGIW